jgi:hypothetical protein
MSESLKLPTAAVAVELALADGAVVAAQLFVPERARRGRALALELAELLDGGSAFLPARDADGHVVLYAKRALVYVKIELGDSDDGDDVLYDQRHDVEVVLERRPTLVGQILYTSPADRLRVIDHLNQPSAFLRLWTAASLYVIGKPHVLRVREIG